MFVIVILHLFLGGFTIPEGTAITVLTTLLHRDPEFFPDPEMFDPDRWLSDIMAARHPYCYAPFSAGLRNCIGKLCATAN
jgi:cytochrome P450